MRLVIAKTKVTPKKTLSVAKLELQAALLAARLANTVTKGTRINLNRRWLWTDSSCTRQWIRASSPLYNPFVGNRIGEIQSLTKPEEWRHVPGRLNPADAATRSDLNKLSSCWERWTNGPDFLLKSENYWPQDIGPERINEEMKTKFQLLSCVAGSTFVPQAHPSLFHWERHSCFYRLTRIAARVLLLKNCLAAKVRGWPEVSKVIDVDLIEEATHLLIRQAQAESFSTEMDTLKKNEDCKGSRLIPLSPFIDDEGLLRTGGRIGRALLPYDAKHPFILDSKSRFSELLVQRYHNVYHHPGINHLLGLLRQKYWIIGGRELCKKLGRQCRDCHKVRVKPLIQKMSDLPLRRLEPQAAFHSTSVDMFGPYTVRLGTAREGMRGRPRMEQRYGMIFTCMVTRAVHLEVAESASTPHFLNALRIFSSLRGQVNYLYSDNGKNYIGAEKHLKPVLERLSSDPEFQDILVARGIKWHRYPPRAPHFGGLHEALIKSAKRALHHTMDIAQRRGHLTEGELRLLFAEVTAFLNARPLTYISGDPADGVLTPNDFLAPKAIFAPPPGITDASAYGKSYERLQQLTNEAWKIWTREYLPALTTRAKWQSAQRNAQVGDLVLIVDNNLPRGEWRTGRIT